MARRFQEITEVYRQEIAALARADRWTAFLRSACRNYKLPFEEQVLVHAQRPDATAVLEIERWNRQFGRWVNKGATGIAVFDRDYPGRTRLKYYFDISDTHESRLSRPVPLWQVPTEQEPDVIEALENRFGALDDKGTLEEAIVSAMENAAADNMTDYLDDLQNCRDNSLLEELDELNLSVLYRRLLENSTAYMLMCRCGLEPDEYFDPEDFSEVFNFNTPETLNALGVATRDIAESGLSAIALTVRSRQKQIRTIAQAPGNEYPIDKQTETQTERSENHGTDIHDEGRLPAAGSAAAAGAGNSPWEIRPATPEVSEGAPEGAVHEPADIGQAERASGGDRPDGAAARGTDGDGDGSGRGRDGSMDGGNIKAVTTYGTKRITAYHILEQTLNQRVVKVFDTVVEDGKERPVLNVKETAIAQDRQELIKSKFADWLWQDIDRRERLCRIYNDTFNSIRPREYDGSHIRFVGMNPEISLRKHQVNAIAHVLYGGNALLAHEVGAGKTFEIVAAAMEMKRLGLCTKSLIVVPNHITEQWAAEWLQLYPAANILVATERDFEKRNRRRLCARIATGDYDAIIIGHSQLMKIPLSRERQQAILQRQIDEVLLAISDAKRQKAENFTIKQMERTRKSLEARLEKLNDQSTKDDTVTFEELGIDRLFIDESHNFKNLFLMTKMRNVGGIAQTEAQKSSDLFAKCQYLDELTDSHGVIFATGTPISNSMVELYTVQRYLQYQTLQEMGLIHFDDWASDYGETVTAIELSPEGYTLVGR